MRKIFGRFYVIGIGLSFVPFFWEIGKVRPATGLMWALGPFRFGVRPPKSKSSEKRDGG
jgi:hypothetical protein